MRKIRPAAVAVQRRYDRGLKTRADRGEPAGRCREMMIFAMAITGLLGRVDAAISSQCQSQPHLPNLWGHRPKPLPLRCRSPYRPGSGPSFVCLRLAIHLGCDVQDPADKVPSIAPRFTPVPQPDTANHEVETPLNRPPVQPLTPWP